jgi:quaternary ammonium compound-resistance protein SugE
VLFLAGLFEVGWANGLKYTAGFTRLWPSVGTVVAMIVSLGLLGIAMKTLPVGTAYAVWVGIGAIGTVVLGIMLLGEPMNALRIISVMSIVAGIIGLKLATNAGVASTTQSPFASPCIRSMNASASSIEHSISFTSADVCRSMLPSSLRSLPTACAFRLCFGTRTRSWKTLRTGCINFSARRIDAIRLE